MFFDQLSLDLGTASTKLVDLERELVLQESSMIAFQSSGETTVAVGNRAEPLRGRYPDNFVLSYPIQQGKVVLPYEAEAMLSYFLRYVYQSQRFFRPRIVICLPNQASVIERKAIKETIEQSGGISTHFIDIAIATAIGADLPVLEPGGTMIINIGAGITQVAIISNTGVLLADTSNIAGNYFTEVIQRAVKQKYQLDIGWLSAQTIKHQIGSVDANITPDNQAMKVAGLNLLSGLPTLELLQAEELTPLLTEAAQMILITIRRVFERLPPELALDIQSSGILLAGGGACLHGLGSLIEREFKIHTRLAEDPINIAALGAYTAMKNPEQYSIFLKS